MVKVVVSCSCFLRRCMHGSLRISLAFFASKHIYMHHMGVIRVAYHRTKVALSSNEGNHDITMSSSHQCQIRAHLIWCNAHSNACILRKEKH